MLRVSGKRTLAKLNAVDLVLNVALGSTLATVLLSKSTSLSQGVLAFALRSLRFPAVEALAKSSLRILLVDGIYLEAALREERVSQEEIRAAIRGAGIGDVAAVAAVVLETDGSLSVIARGRAGAARPFQFRPPTHLLADAACSAQSAI